MSVERARAFARACIEMTDLGRAAMGVMDGGVFAGARLVKLAGRIVKGGSLLQVTPSPTSKKAP